MTRTPLVEGAPSARSAALAFMSGISKGWSYRSFMEWYTRHLFVSGRMRPMAPWRQVIFREPGVGVVQLVEDPRRMPLRTRLDTMARFHLATVSAHTRVLTVLRRHVASHSIEFVHAALYSGRLERAAGCAEPEGAWSVSLEPADALSDWVLALFAADYMIHPNDYLQGLRVCRICGQVQFCDSPGFRGLCEVHGAAWRALHGDRAGQRDVAPASGVVRKQGGAPDCGVAAAGSRPGARHRAAAGSAAVRANARAGR